MAKTAQLAHRHKRPLARLVLRCAFIRVESQAISDEMGPAAKNAACRHSSIAPERPARFRIQLRHAIPKVPSASWPAGSLLSPALDVPEPACACPGGRTRPRRYRFIPFSYSSRLPYLHNDTARILFEQTLEGHGFRACPELSRMDAINPPRRRPYRSAEEAGPW